MYFPASASGASFGSPASAGTTAAARFFTSDHEHVLAYGMPEFRFGGTEKSFAMYSNPDNDPRGDWRVSDLTVSVRHDDKRAGNAYYPIQDPETGVWYPCNPNAVWRYASRSRLRPGQRTKTATMEEFIEQGKVLFPRGQRVQIWNSMEELLVAIDAGVNIASNTLACFSARLGLLPRLDRLAPATRQPAHPDERST